jgi:hypothetical protein
MFTEILRFELAYRSRRPATYLYFFILFLFFFVESVNGWVPGSEKAFVNSSLVIHSMTVITTIFGVMIASAIMGVPVYRDIEHDTRGYYLSYPITEKGYLLGRYLGSLLVLVAVCLGALAGLMLGAALGPVFGFEEANRFGPLNLPAYANAVLIFLLPNLFFTGTLFFSLVALTRKIFVAYTGSILFFIGYLLASALTRDIEQRDLAAILDPFGLNAFNNESRYWTPIEQNTRLIPLAGTVLWNRLLWVGLALAVFSFTLYRFTFQDFLAVKLGKRKADPVETALPAPLVRIPRVIPAFSTGVHLREMFRLAWLEFTNVVRDIYFLGILLGGVLFLFLDGWFGFPQFGTPSLPMTFYMLEVKDFNYIVFVYILLIFYTGEVVHRDRSVRFNQIADTLPVPNWLVYGSKLLALVYICLMLVNLPLVCGVLNQVLKGYFHFEFGKYFTDLYLIELPEYLQLTLLTFFVHTLVNNKFPGHVISIGLWVLMFSLRQFAEYNYNLFFYSYTPGYTLSDMNGFGHFLRPLALFNVYWLAFGGILLTGAGLLWARGTETSFRTRLKLARQRFTRPAAAALALFTVLWLGTGAYIYYNVSVRNRYVTAKQARDDQAEFEKRYRKLERALQPKITDVKLFADVYPQERRATVRAVCTMTNKWQKPIDTLYVNSDQKLRYLKIDGATLTPFFRDALLVQTGGMAGAGDGKREYERGFLWYRLPKTLQPGDTVRMETLVELSSTGFPNSGAEREVVYNGTFFSGGIPSFGYNPGAELTSDKERKKRGLPEKKYTQPPQNDPWGLGNLLFNDDADYVTFDALVSTSPDQIAVSPGYLQKTWEKDGRKYFHYKMDGEMDMFFNVVSARYAVARDVWKGADGQAVNIEIYHHPTHTYNVDRFIKSVKVSLDYYHRHFTPYQYRQMRIMEFPRYAAFAQSFPNTVPYSESFAWLGDFSDPDKTDYGFTVTAHEVAHQWWGHQVTPSNTRGANQLSESMAEYSSLMVLKQEYGEEAMQKFLKYELDRYLEGRAGERKFEETLLQNDSRAYVWYQKGGLVMYALTDYIGEDAVNRGLKNFLEKAAFRQQAPFATTNEFYPYLEAVTPDSLRYFLEDSWKKIALYENRATNATYTKGKDNEYKVKLTVDTRKIYYDGLGNEQSTGKGREYIDIGIFAEDGKNARGMTAKKPLYLRKHWLTPGQHTLEFTVKGKPVKAGIDPYNKLIDRVPDDNLKSVEEAE